MIEKLQNFNETNSELKLFKKQLNKTNNEKFEVDPELDALITRLSDYFTEDKLDLSKLSDNNSKNDFYNILKTLETGSFTYPDASNNTDRILLDKARNCGLYKMDGGKLPSIIESLNLHDDKQFVQRCIDIYNIEEKIAFNDYKILRTSGTDLSKITTISGLSGDFYVTLIGLENQNLGLFENLDSIKINSSEFFIPKEGLLDGYLNNLLKTLSNNNKKNISIVIDKNDTKYNEINNIITSYNSTNNTSYKLEKALK